MQPRPAAITILAALCWLAGGVNVIGALQNFGHLPTLSSSGTSLLAENHVDGWLLAAMAIISLFLAGGLWAVHPWARRVVLVVAALNILATLVTQFEGGASWLAVVPGVVVNLAILVYARTADARTELNG